MKGCLTESSWVLHAKMASQ
uniref:Uncharacterized protein n=1 Tax=Anguilla anguilla TaxID=7936 RepID=A0A0E9SJZ2_ANGAN